MEDKTTKIEVPIKTLVTITLFALALWAVYLVFDVLVLLLAAFILVSALSPLVAYFESNKIPRPLAVTMLYLLLFFIVGGLLAVILPLVIDQTANLINHFPLYLREFSRLVGPKGVNQQFFNGLPSQFGGIGSNIFQLTVGVFSLFVSAVTVAVLAFYLLLDEKNLKRRLENSLPENYRARVMRLVETVQQRLGAWVRGQLVLSLIIAVFYFIGLLALRVDYPIALGLIGGLLEIVPVIGPIVAAIPAVVIAFTQAPILALAVIGLYFVVQQLESHVVIPNVMKRAVGLPPLMILIALLVGGKIFGIIGTLLAVPVLVIIHVILFDYWQVNLNKSPAKTK